jgi:hypothetical protein
MKSQSQLLKNMFSNPELTQIQNGHQEAKLVDADMERRIEQFLEYQEEASQHSLAEGFELGINGAPIDLEAFAKDGSTPAVKIGTGTRGNPLMLGKSGLNAIVALVARKYVPNENGQYDRFIREAYFNPISNAEGIKTERVAGVYRFYDWENGILVTPSKMKDSRRAAQTRKHTAIDQILLSVKYGSVCQFTMLNDDLEAHFQKTVRDRLEMSLPEVWELIGKDYENAQSNEQFTRGNKSPSTRQKEATKDEYIKFAEELAKLEVPVMVQYQTVGNPYVAEFKFDPTASAQTVEDQLNGIRFCSRPVEYLGWEEIES